jgi:diguanylate cyclase (GGDEF)-like protein
MFVSRFTLEDLPDSPHSRQLKAGFPWLTFAPELESVFRRTDLEENLRYIRINLSLALAIILAFWVLESKVLGAQLARIPNMIHLCVIMPILLAGIAATFSSRRHRVYPPLALTGCTVVAIGIGAIQLLASVNGLAVLFPCLLLTSVFIYFMGGLVFYHALAANLVAMFAYIGVGSALPLAPLTFAYQALALMSVNVFCASVVFTHEKTSRLRFLEAGLLRELVARDGLTGIQNRRMFDQHIERVWRQAIVESVRVAVLLIDIDCFKDYNDRYGHQAGDECLRAVAVSLSRCARQPQDFVARYGGEEFAVVLYRASREYMAEVTTRIQRSLAELNIPHEASRAASRLTVSIGASLASPTENRKAEGLIQLADEALYSAKEQGRNRVVVMEAEYHTLYTGRFDKRRGQRAL